MTHLTRSPRAGVSWNNLPSPGLIYAGLASIARTMLNRRAAMRLADMPDYLLTDIGLKRDDVHDALSRDWREDPTFRLAVTASRRRRGR